jgi:ABC-type branched-subunit amino acid transport system substrate-binding protein
MTLDRRLSSRRDAARRGLAMVLVSVLVVAAFAFVRSLAPAPIRIGAVFPLSSNAAVLAGPELKGVQIAVDLVNADGGVAGRPIELEVRDLRSRSEADGVMRDLKAQGIEIVIGAYSSDLSIAASEAADRAGLLYWEAGAVADRLTGRGLPMVFRVGTNGRTLGENAAAFAADELAGRLGKPIGDLRVAIAVAEDDYTRAVADAAVETARARGAQVVLKRGYHLALPDWPSLMAELAAARPDVIILASHIPDGIAFRQAMLAAGVTAGALIGATMAECDPDFAGVLGEDAIGIFASDRPTAGFQPTALGAEASAAYARFAPAWASAARQAGGEGDAPAGGYGAGDGEGRGDDDYGYGGSRYTIFGPDRDATAEESEEALAGFSAAWALFRHVLPAAIETGAPVERGTAAALSAASVADAARLMDLPEGSLPNGAGLRFSIEPETLGQNERAAAVIWQWQAERVYEFVWPPSYQTSEIAFVPLDR